MFRNLYDMGKFIDTAGPWQRDYITSLTFAIHGVESVDAMKVYELVTQCTALRKLSIVAHEPLESTSHLGHITPASQLEGFKILLDLENVVSVRYLPEEDTATILFSPFTEPDCISMIESTVGRVFLSRTGAKLQPRSGSTRNNFMPVTDGLTQAFTALEKHRDYPPSYQRPWQRGTIAYGRVPQPWIIDGAKHNYVSIYNNWS